MRYLLALFLLPPFLIFGLYHLTLWFGLFGMRARAFWRRVALSSALSHVLFTFGVFGVVWADYQSATALFGNDPGFPGFLANSSGILQLMLVFDTLAAVALIGILTMLGSAGLEGATILSLGAGVVLVLGTFQWYWLGGAAGALLERVWSGLKTQEDDGPDWL